VILRKFIQFCSEELQRTARYLATGYAAVREMDEMALATLKTYFRDR
jgi:hypothetical protein